MVILGTQGSNLTQISTKRYGKGTLAPPALVHVQARSGPRTASGTPYLLVEICVKLEPCVPKITMN